MTRRRSALVVSAFAVGVLITGHPAFAQGDTVPPGTPFQQLQQEIAALRTQIANLRLRVNQLSQQLQSMQVSSVPVDCTQGGSINAALDTLARVPGPVRITVNGTCNEAVNIRRDDVTLEGLPGAGIALVGPGNVVSLNSAQRTFMRGLTITGGSTGILVAGGGSLNANDLLVTGAQSSGVQVFGYAFVTNSRFENMQNNGAGTGPGGELGLTNVTIDRPHGMGVSAFGGRISLNDGTVIDHAGFHGAVADGSGVVIVHNATITYSAIIGAFAGNGGMVFVDGPSAAITHSTFDGVAGQGGSVAVSNGAVISDNGGNGVIANNGSHVFVHGGAVRIENNGNSGVTLGSGSSALFQAGPNGAIVINSNKLEGIDLADATVVSFFDNNTQITGNGNYGLRCSPDAMIAGRGGHMPTFSGNGNNVTNCRTTY